MTLLKKKQIRELVNLSITKGSLDPKKVELIASSLKRKELKKYIKALKKEDLEQQVIIKLPQQPTDAQKNVFDSLFPNKKIIYHKDQSLLLGVKIINNDMEHQLNLKNNLNTILSHIINK